MLANIMKYKKVSPLKYSMEESRILLIYRYLSLLITSTFYMLNHSEHSLMRRIFIIVCLTISSVVLSYLYLKNEKSKQNIKILILIETVGNSILLIPSGGVNSPFVWYTLNTILISSVFLTKLYCWFNLLIYILSSTVLVYFVFDEELSNTRLLIQESNLILSLVMIVAAIQAWSMYLKKVKRKNEILKDMNCQLQSANQMIVESIDHIKSLYQSVNILTNKGNED